MEICTGYVNIFVSDFDTSLAFYEDVLQLPLIFADAELRYAAFATPGAQLAITHSDQPELVGRHTGVGLTVTDLDATYITLKNRVTFTAPPERQPWGGYMAMVSDPDGNLFYLDQFTNPTNEIA